MRELPVPSAVKDDPHALELARIWAAHRRQFVIFNEELWSDPAQWGIFLVDFARHIADAYADLGKEKEDVLNRILEGFRAEWSNSTLAA